MGLLGANMSSGVQASFRDVAIKIPDRGCDQGCEWLHAPEAWAEIWEKSVSWVPASEEEGWLSLARRGLAVGVHVVWGRWKSQVYLSPYVEIPLNSKIIKSFIPELRSRKGFVFRDCVLWTLWTFCVPVWICLFHVFISGFVTLEHNSKPSDCEAPVQEILGNMEYLFIAITPRSTLTWSSSTC